MDDSVVVSDERLAVRKRPAAVEADGFAGVELVATALVDSTVSFRIVEALPEAVDLEEVRLFREPEGGQWWRDAERNRLVFQGSVEPGEELVARWAVPATVDPAGGALLRPPDIEGSTRTVEVGAHVDEISDTIRRLESSFDRHWRGSRTEDAETSDSAPASGPGEAGEGGTLVEGILEEIESGRVARPQLAALLDHLGAAARRRRSATDDGDSRAAEEPVADPTLSVLRDPESRGDRHGSPPDGTTNGDDGSTADEPGQPGRISTVRSRLRGLERRVEQLEAAIEEREAAQGRQVERIDALEDEFGEAVRELREEIEDVRERRRRMADALRRPGETPATE